MKITTLIISALLFSTAMFAQKGVEDRSKFGHGEDSIRCMENLSLYSEYYKQKNFKEALPYWTIAFNECPLSTSRLYSDGENIAMAMLKKEKDPTKQEEYYQLLMKVYDQRIQYFGDHKKYPASYINGKKAIAMLTFKKDDPAVVKEAQSLLESSVTERQAKTQPAVLLSYMVSTVATYKMGSTSPEDLVDTYLEISNILDKQIASTSNQATKDKLGEVKNTIEAQFAQSGAADCETLANIFGPQLPEHTQDLDWLKRVNRLLAQGNCTDSDLFYKSSEHLHNIEPSSSSAFGLMQMYLKTHNLEKAIDYGNQAVELEQDPNTKAKYHHYLAMVYMAQKQFAKVRTESQKAIALRPNWGEPYMLIGKAYAATANSYGSNEFEHKTVYWAAVDQFIKAKSVDGESAAAANDLIVMYSQYFPGTEEIFFNNLKDGAAYKVGGWINVQTTVRAKK